MISTQHNRRIEQCLSETERPDGANERWTRLVETMQSAQTELPAVKRINGRKWQTSQQTRELVQNRSDHWSDSSDAERKLMTTKIKRSARKDYRDFVESVVEDIEKCYTVGNVQTSKITDHQGQRKSFHSTVNRQEW